MNNIVSRRCALINSMQNHDPRGGKRRLLSRSVLPWAARYSQHVLGTESVRRARLEIAEHQVELDRIGREILQACEHEDLTHLLFRDYARVLARIDTLGGN